MDATSLIAVLVSTGIIFFIVGFICADPTKEDYESDFDEGCTKSRHFFKIDPAKPDMYCFCGAEVMHHSELNDYLFVKQ